MTIGRDDWTRRAEESVQLTTLDAAIAVSAAASTRDVRGWWVGWAFQGPLVSLESATHHWSRPLVAPAHPHTQGTSLHVRAAGLCGCEGRSRVSRSEWNGIVSRVQIAFGIPPLSVSLAQNLHFQLQLSLLTAHCKLNLLPLRTTFKMFGFGM